MNRFIRWLHISDFHFSGVKNAEWPLLNMQLPFPKIDFLTFAGDLHNFNSDDFDKGIEFIQQIMEQYELTAEDIFIVPGNHDADRVSDREQNIFKEFAPEHLKKINNSENDVMYKGRHLSSRFSKYCKAVQKILGEKSEGTYADVFYKEWKEKINIIHLNTALISNKNTSMKQIVDTTAISEINLKNPQLPAIVLAHHSFYDISEAQHKLLKIQFQQLNVRAYLCGDIHLYDENKILLSKHHEIPCIASPSIYKNTEDHYAETGAYIYEWDTVSPQGLVNIIPYMWEHKNWAKSKSLIGSFNMQDIRKGLHKTIDTSDLNTVILPGVVYKPQDGAASKDYVNNGDAAYSPMLDLFCANDKQYFQLVGNGKQIRSGTGKTSTLLSVFSKLTECEGNNETVTTIPLYFSLKELYGIYDSNRTEPNFILKHAEEKYSIKNSAGKDNANYLFLFDGFDEIVKPAAQIKCLHDIQEIMQDKYPEAAIIITSREPLNMYISLWEYDEINNKFDEETLNNFNIYFHNCYIKELTREQQEKYLENTKKPSSDDPIWDILDTPFYLTLYRNQPQKKDYDNNDIYKRWVTDSFRPYMEGEKEINKTTLLLMSMIKEIIRLGEKNTPFIAEQQRFFLMKVLPFTGYYSLFSERLDGIFSEQALFNFKEEDIYKMTFNCLASYKKTNNCWKEYREYNNFRNLCKAWNGFCELYEKGANLETLEHCVPYSTFLFGMLKCTNGENYFCHDNYRDFFAAFHIANIIYMLSEGVELSTFTDNEIEIFLLQLEVFDHSILLQAEEILLQYFGITPFYDDANFNKLKNAVTDRLSLLVLCSCLVRLLDARIQTEPKRTELYNWRHELYKEFKKTFDELKSDSNPWISDLLRNRYGRFYAYNMSMLARDFRDRNRPYGDLTKCAEHASLCTNAEKEFNIPKADGYLQLGLCINAYMEDLLNCKESTFNRDIDDDYDLINKFYNSLKKYTSGQNEDIFESWKNTFFENFGTWQEASKKVLMCTDIFELILDSAYRKYRWAAKATNKKYATITKLGFISKGYLVIAALGTSGGALNTLAQMLINQANKMECDKRLNLFKENQNIKPHGDEISLDYMLGEEDNFMLAFRLLQATCSIKRGDQPYSNLKSAELVFKEKVTPKQETFSIESALNRAIHGNLSMGYYWKGRYYLNHTENCTDTEKAYIEDLAIGCFLASGVKEFFCSDKSDENKDLKLNMWLSAIELLAIYQDDDFISQKDNIYNEILKKLNGQVTTVTSDSFTLRNELYQLQKEDVRENLNRFQKAVCKCFPGDQTRKECIDELLKSLQR